MVAPTGNLMDRLRYGEPIVVVSGLPRSGTSMAMRMLDAGGLELVIDGIRTADEDNPRGYYELERVKSLDKEADRVWLKEARGKAVKIVSSLLLHLPDTHRYKVLFMRRELDEVLASQKKMLVRREESSEGDDLHMRELFDQHLKKVEYLVKKRPWLDVLDIPYSGVVEDPLGQAERMRDFLNKPLDTRKMAAVVDASLYRNRS